MARSRETKIELTAYDDLFQTDESREEAKLSKIRDIPISEIDEFPDHPFKVLMDEDMEQLVESIKRNGVMTPATVRLKEDGRYELISGHRRKKACELAGLETLKCEVKELTRDEAIIVMVESNLQRSVILPSEKAFAYKMRLEAMKRQAGRPPKENASPLATNLSKGRSDEELGELVGESKDQIWERRQPCRTSVRNFLNRTNQKHRKSPLLSNYLQMALSTPLPSIPMWIPTAALSAMTFWIWVSSYSLSVCLSCLTVS